MEKKVALIQNDRVVLEAHQADIREKIEEMLEEKIGFSPDMQEDVDEEYELYLHTDSYDDLSEDELEKLDLFGITEDGESTTAAIYKLLDIRCEVVGDWTRN